jgi:hypothetical protein
VSLASQANFTHLVVAAIATPAHIFCFMDVRFMVNAQCHVSATTERYVTITYVALSTANTLSLAGLELLDYVPHIKAVMQRPRPSRVWHGASAT